jgi:hypothetical protein
VELRLSADKILAQLGQNIYRYFLEKTSAGDPFLLLIEPEEYRRLKEKTGNTDDVDSALKTTGRLTKVPPDDYISIAVANLQVQLIYDIATEKIDDSFYAEMKKYYPNLTNDSDVQRYFGRFQEDMWKKVRNIFKKENIFLEIPKPKHGSERYVQYPKSQRIITWKEIIVYADKFKRIGLEPHQILSFSEFCEKVHIHENYHLDDEQNKIIRKIIFSFYNNWDGSKTEDLKKPRHTSRSQQLFFKKRTDLANNRFEFTIKIENEKLRYYFEKSEIFEEAVKNQFNKKPVLPFLLDEEYEDWIYTAGSLHSNNQLLVLVDKTRPCEQFKPEFTTEYYNVYHFKNCDNKIAEFAGLQFTTKEYFTIIGGIRVINCYHARNDVLGAWYDFALPVVKIDSSASSRVFIDSNEIIVENNCIDLSNLTLKESHEKRILESREKEYSLKCTNLSAVYFQVSGISNGSIDEIEKGWKISSTSLRPIKSGETPDIAGLLFNYSPYTNAKGNFRPFLYKIDYLQNRLSHIRLDERITKQDRRGWYGI